MPGHRVSVRYAPFDVSQHQLFADPYEADAVENGFIVHRGLHVTAIDDPTDDPTDDHLHPVGFVAHGCADRGGDAGVAFRC
ncbi:hypothetical protein [Streptomyces sp. NPDC047841]|uniref:hypothetical protein n=1 Tax=Streptomyces sp. NPDC047841 TaxID=3154708 RepID=UPI003453F730